MGSSLKRLSVSQVIREVSDIGLFCQAIASTLKYPNVDGQNAVLARMAEIAAEKSSRLQAEISAAIDVEDK